MLIALKIATGVGICLLCSAVPWAARRLGNPPAMIALGAFAAFALISTAAGVPLYPYSNLVVLGVATSGGLLLGRALPTRFVPVLVVMLALSILDLVQVALLNGPPSTTASAQSSPDPHLIWLNVRLPLPSGHFAIGFADLLLVTALAENFRRTRTSWPVASLPGVVALVTGTVIASTAAARQLVAGAFSQALIPYLTGGWLVAFAVARLTAPKSSPQHSPR